MLKELISHSLHCSQYIKYDCYKAPLDLHSATWFTSAAQEELINFIGYAKRGSCPCSSINIDKLYKIYKVVKTYKLIEETLKYQKKLLKK